MADERGKSADDGGEPASRSWLRRLFWQAAKRGSAADSPESTPEPSTLRRLRVWIRRLAGFGLMRASSSLRNPPSSGEPIRARARLESTRIEERYRYRQDISLNAAVDMADEPAGSIEMVLPYDGEEFFTRQAYRDVARSRDPNADTDALVGFLTLTGYQDTDLDRLSNLWETPGSIPVQVRLPASPGPGEADPLLADNSACVVSHDYHPSPRIGQLAPVRVDIAVNDPDTAEFSLPVARGEPGLARVRIMRHVEFKAGLSLSVRVSLHVPRRLANGAYAEVSEVFIGWPTRTSLGSLELRIDGQAHRPRYNPEWENPDSPDGKKECGLEWWGIPMTLEPEPIGGDIRTFCSPTMVLSIPRPGEVYWQESLSGRVEVTINRLLSGMEARLFNATGKRSRYPAPEISSTISTTFSLNLDDAFAWRTLSPYQQLYFGEVVPSSMRIDDIITALRNRGFEVDNPPADLDPKSCLLIAERIHGPKRLSLVLYVQGQRYRAQRQREVPGGLTYRTHVDSGELRIYVYGFLARDSQPVIQEVNALRRALHERFNRLPAWR